MSCCSRRKKMNRFARINMLLAVLIGGLSAPLFASTSETKAGIRYFDIVMAYEGEVDATKSAAEEPSKVKFQKVLKHFAYGIYQCSQGKHKLRKVRIFSKVKGEGDAVTDNWTSHANACDIKWSLGSGVWPMAPSGGDPYSGVRQGYHIKICDKPTKGGDATFDLSNEAYLIKDTRTAGAVLTHEWGHYHYSLLDEYPDNAMATEDVLQRQRLNDILDIKNGEYHEANAAFEQEKIVYNAAVTD